MSTEITPHQGHVEEIHRTQLAIFPSSVPGEKPLVAAVKCTSTGIIKSTLTQVVLTERMGQVYTVQGKQKPTIDGYRHLNTFRGVKIIEPDVLIDEEGRRHPNPYFERDKRGTVRRITVKKVGIGRDALGNFAVFSQTLEFDLHVYFVQDLLKKWAPWQNNPAKGWGTLYDAERIPPEIMNDGTKKIVYTAEDTALVVDLAHPDVQGVINQHTSRWKFASRMADSICERRILAKFIPIGQLVPSTDDRFYVPIVGWSDCERDYEEWRDLAIAAVDGDTQQMIEGQAVQVEASKAEPTAEEFDQGSGDIDMMGEPGDTPAPQAPPAAPGVDVPPPVETPPDGIQPSPTDAQAVANYQQRIGGNIDRLGQGKADEIIKAITNGRANAGNAAEIVHVPTLKEIDAALFEAIDVAANANMAGKQEAAAKDDPEQPKTDGAKPPGTMF